MLVTTSTCERRFCRNISKSGSNIQKMSPTSKTFHQFLVTNITVTLKLGRLHRSWLNCASPTLRKSLQLQFFQLNLSNFKFHDPTFTIYTSQLHLIRAQRHIKGLHRVRNLSWKNKELGCFMLE